MTRAWEGKFRHKRRSVKNNVEIYDVLSILKRSLLLINSSRPGRSFDEE